MLIIVAKWIALKNEALLQNQVQQAVATEAFSHMPVNKSPPWPGKEEKKIRFIFTLCTLPGSKGTFTDTCVVSSLTLEIDWDQHICLESLTSPKEE